MMTQKGFHQALETSPSPVLRASVPNQKHIVWWSPPHFVYGRRTFEVPQGVLVPKEREREREDNIPSHTLHWVNLRMERKYIERVHREKTTNINRWIDSWENGADLHTHTYRHNSQPLVDMGIEDLGIRA